MGLENALGRVATSVWKRRHPEWARPADGQLLPTMHLSPRTVPRYLLDRARVRRTARARPPRPWITQHAHDLLDQWLRPTDVGIEFGAGGTTTFFARRVGRVHSVEGFDHWHAPLAARLRDEGVRNVSLVLASSEVLGYQSDAHRTAYVEAHPHLEPGSLDFAFVDGEYRDACALRAIELLRPGGLLVLDNAEIYLPSETRSPWRTDVPVTSRWERFVKETATWRSLWTTNGVWDTAFWVKS
jgi:hypothetical protein